MLPDEVARAFADAINRQSVEAIAEWMTDDHVFVDSLGNCVEGKQKMRAGWGGYFGMMPDYSITVSETLGSGDTVVMVGTAQGTYAVEGELRSENRWQIPAAWRAVVQGERVAEWRVYADNEPVRQIMRRVSGAG